MNSEEHPELQSVLEKIEEFRSQGLYEKSNELLQKLIVEYPQYFVPYEMLADNYLSMRQFSRCSKAINQAIKLAPKSSNAHYLKGFLFSLKNNWGEAIDSFLTADELSSNHPEILRCLGWAYFNAGEIDRGVAILTRANILLPDDVGILCDLGVCHMNLENFSEAEKLFQRASLIDPQSEQVIECLAMLQSCTSSFSDISTSKNRRKK